MRPARGVLALTLGMVARVRCHAAVKHRGTHLADTATWRATRAYQLLGLPRFRAVFVAEAALGARHRSGAVRRVGEGDGRRWLAGATRMTAEAVEWPVGERRNCDCWRRWASLQSAGWEP